jgi:hypothetical protein
VFGLHVHRCFVVAASEPPAGLPAHAVLLDPARDAHARDGADRSVLYLVRPDGYVGFRSRPALARPLLDHLGTLFVRTSALRGG